MLVDELKPGTRVRITQAIRRRAGDWHTSVTGEVVSCAVQQTGSWYAPSPTGRLRLLRVHLRKADGELTTVNVDRQSRVEILPGGPET